MTPATLQAYRLERERQQQLRDLFAEVVTDHLNALSELAARIDAQAKREGDGEVRAVLEHAARQMRVEWKLTSTSVVLRLALMSMASRLP